MVFKRYQPIFQGDTTTKFTQLQRGSRGIFVGFPKHQAGWLIYVPQKIGNKHLVVSMDVIFDQNFLSNIEGTNLPFAQAQPEIEIGKVGGPRKVLDESTGDLTNLIDYEVSHWGDNEPSVTPISITSTHNDKAISKTLLLSENEPELGSELVDGMRRSSRVRRLEKAYACANDFEIIKAEQLNQTFDEIEEVFSALDEAAKTMDVPLDPYLPEPKGLDEIKRLSPQIQKEWLAASKKELKFIIENETLDGGMRRCSRVMK